jgi:N-acetylglutamate synthase-like GNAT family acetyltransferase
MVQISDLWAQPKFFGIVADRIWHAFWRESGRPPAAIADRLREHLVPNPIPFTLVAHDRDRFLGTASVIACDVEIRPDLSPWIAALWVEAAERERGIGAALLERTTQAAFGLDLPRLYLCAAPRRRPFYEKRGWVLHEDNVPRSGMSILTRRRMR